MTSSDKHKLKDNLTCLTPQLTFHLSTSESPKIKTTVMNSPIHFGDTLKSICKKNLFLLCVKIDKIQPFTTHYVHLSILCCSKTSISLTVTSPQARLKKIIRLWYFIIQNKTNPNQRQLSLSSEEWKIPKCHSLSKYL